MSLSPIQPLRGVSAARLSFPSFPAGSMIVIAGLQDFYYNVGDMARAVTFYRDVLGLELVEEGEYWSSFRLGDTNLGLHWTEGPPVPPVPPVPRDSHGAHAGGTLTFATDDVDASLTTLRDRGARILGTLNEPWGRLVVRSWKCFDAIGSRLTARSLPQDKISLRPG